MMNQAMNSVDANNFESDEAKELYINSLIDETQKLEDKAKLAKAFVEMYESDNFKLVILDGLLNKHAAAKAVELTNPHTTKELEEEILVELKALRYLRKFLDNSLITSKDADRLVRDNKQLLLDIQSGKEDR